MIPPNADTRIAGEGGAVRIEQRLAGRHATRIGVFDDDDGRRAVGEFGDEFERGVGIVIVVVAEFLALHLVRLCDAGRRGASRKV